MKGSKAKSARLYDGVKDMFNKEDFPVLNNTDSNEINQEKLNQYFANLGSTYIVTISDPGTEITIDENKKSTLNPIFKITDPNTNDSVKLQIHPKGQNRLELEFASNVLNDYGVGPKTEYKTLNNGLTVSIRRDIEYSRNDKNRITFGNDQINRYTEIADKVHPVSEPFSLDKLNVSNISTAVKEFFDEKPTKFSLTDLPSKVLNGVKLLFKLKKDPDYLTQEAEKLKNSLGNGGVIDLEGEAMTSLKKTLLPKKYQGIKSIDPSKVQQLTELLGLYGTKYDVMFSNDPNKNGEVKIPSFSGVSKHTQTSENVSYNTVGSGSKKSFNSLQNSKYDKEGNFLTKEERKSSQLQERAGFEELAEMKSNNVITKYLKQNGVTNVKLKNMEEVLKQPELSDLIKFVEALEEKEIDIRDGNKQEAIIKKFQENSIFTRTNEDIANSLAFLRDKDNYQAVVSCGKLSSDSLDTLKEFVKYKDKCIEEFREANKSQSKDAQPAINMSNMGNNNNTSSQLSSEKKQKEQSNNRINALIENIAKDVSKMPENNKEAINTLLGNDESLLESELLKENTSFNELKTLITEDNKAAVEASLNTAVFNALQSKSLKV